MLKVSNLEFSYLKKLTLFNTNFNLEKGKNLVLIGESGCGKSTLLKLIYGLFDLDKGTIFWNDIEVLGPKYNLIPGMNFMKYLAQDFDLMPFITVAENVGKHLSNVDLEKKQQRILELLDVVEMTEYASVKAKYLSGGQMQRVAIARVLALEPELLLLDEPFSHIDNFRKNSLRRKLFEYFKLKNITTIIATHDSTDVLSFSDEVLILKAGKIIEKGIPKDIYNSPKSVYIASLFGDVNQISSHFFNEKNDDSILLYPHQLEVVKHSKLKVLVKKTYFRGSHYLIECNYENGTLFFENKTNIDLETVVFLNKKDL
ncbi:ABC transporter ATP-binding protein [Flavobacterium sp.]|uniref:ABC transporter ATP-binding protein n=1 Tax=Flavobacterium sp. TaxID=239 RepID=UPI0037529BD6